MKNNFSRFILIVFDILAIFISISIAYFTEALLFEIVLTNHKQVEVERDFYNDN